MRAISVTVVMAAAAALPCRGPAADPRPAASPVYPMLIEVRADRTTVAPGEPVRLTGTIRAASIERPVGYDIYEEEIGWWDADRERMFGLTKVISFGTGTIPQEFVQVRNVQLGGPHSVEVVSPVLPWDVTAGPTVGLVREYRPSHLGVNLVSFVWKLSPTKSVVSPPVVVTVRPPVGKDGKPAVDPKTLVPKGDASHSLLFHRRHPIGFEAAVDRPAAAVGEAVTLTVPGGGPVCIDAARLAGYDPKVGQLVQKIESAPAIDPADDLGLVPAQEVVKTPAGKATVREFRPRRLGVYLITATRVEADGKARTTGTPVVLVVRPPAGPGGKPVAVKPEWLSAPPVPYHDDPDPRCELDAGLPTRNEELNRRDKAPPAGDPR